MRRYETILIVRPNVGEEELADIIDKVSSIITNDGGTIIKIDKWGLKKLAYLIKKENQGYYVYIDYAGISATIAEIERISKIDDRLLKYMTVKLADSCDPTSLIQEIAQSEQAADEETASEETQAPALETDAMDEAEVAPPEVG